ncbi:hypothetical protein Hamer_G027345 [Homarus americanus]|uniref:Uncharacterized protein n=1 Tax=Homarus americanus TaxID=6706 RepID=A0A8J5KDR7_HOMAM|nr:hypothetical protein Hamer_G027345 [Homarus americanus]
MATPAIRLSVITKVRKCRFISCASTPQERMFVLEMVQCVVVMWMNFRPGTARRGGREPASSETVEAISGCVMEVNVYKMLLD